MEVKVHAVLTHFLVCLGLNIVECVDESLDISLDEPMHLLVTITIVHHFLDGIVLTYGSPRCHIWSFTVGNRQYRTDKHGCPCNIGFTGSVPPYIQDDYFCDSGYPYSGDIPLNYFMTDPLWDGDGCIQGNCCTFNSPPWFCKTLPLPTDEDIELRLCLDEATSNEDTPFEVVEIYVQ